MSTLASGSTVSVTLTAGSVLELSAPAGSSGYARSIQLNRPGFAIDVREGQSKQLGPYSYDASVEVTSVAGVLFYSTSTFALAGTDGGPADVTLAAAPAGATVCEVTITFKDAAGVAIPLAVNFDVWLSDAATGAGLTGTSASGTVTAKAASGIVLATITAKKALRVQSLGTGIFVLEITDTGATAFKVCVQHPTTGLPVILTLAAGDYGV